MRYLKSLVFGSLLALSFAFAGSAAVVHAQLFDDICKQAPNSTVCQEQRKSQTKSSNVIYGKNGVIMKATNLLALVVGIAAVIVVAVSGIRYIFSAGDPNSISNAKRAIIYALVGLVVAIVARSIIAFVINRL